MSVAVEDARAQIDRILHAKPFETSEVHRRLLQYLAGKTLCGDAGGLKEYTVGLEAFGKPPTYDPRHDSIVRLQVGRLRQKLLEYYQSQAARDEIVVSLPKGAFRMSFEAPRPHRAENGAGALGRLPAGLLAGALALSVTWATVATVAYLRAERAAAPVTGRWNPELEALWAPFLESNRSVLVCLGTPLFVRLPGHGFFREPKLNDWAEVQKSARFVELKKALGETDAVPSYAFTGAGEANAAFLISGLLSTRRQDLLMTRSSILSWQQIADHNVVFIGPPKFNLQLQSAALQQDIVVEANGIRNLKPRAGEPAFLEDLISVEKPQEGETHALISRMRGPSGNGELLVIAGNASADTFAAAEWLTQPARARELVQRLRTPPGALPRYFQAVIKVSFRQGIPVQSSYVFHHAL